MLLTIIILIIKVYFLLGFIFGIYFMVMGAKKIDPAIADSKFKVRLLLFPGAIGMWPFLVKKAFKK